MPQGGADTSNWTVAKSAFCRKRNIEDTSDERTEILSGKTGQGRQWLLTRKNVGNNSNKGSALRHKSYNDIQNEMYKTAKEPKSVLVENISNLDAISTQKYQT